MYRMERMPPEDRDTVVRLRGYKTRHVQQHRLATVSDRPKWRAKLEECWRQEQQITISSGVCCRLGSGPSSWWKSVSDVSMDMERADDLANQSVISEAPLLFFVKGREIF